MTTKADLLDRGLIIQTDTIPKGNRRRMAAIWKKFYAIRPQLLGYILDILVKVLKWKKDNPGIELIKDLPRMADWAEWSEIISRRMGEADNAFIDAYNQNINLQTEEIIGSSDIAITLEMFMKYRNQCENSNEWKDTATKLLTELNTTALANGIDIRTSYWPKSPGRLSRILKTLQRTLREIGIELVWDKDTSTKKSTRMITICYIPSELSDCQKVQNLPQNNGQPSDNTENKENKDRQRKSVKLVGKMTLLTLLTLLTVL